MASVFAIVSKAIFDEDFPSTQCGNVLPIDRYVSKHPSFAQMGKGDAIFLFTVRPKDQPWLVAIVEAPKKKGKAWVGKKNTTPVRDITAVMPKLVFSTGKGVGPYMTGLGMTLQTPRKLTEDDVVLLRGASPAVQEYRAQVKAIAPAAAAGPTTLELVNARRPFEMLAKLPDAQKKQLAFLTKKNQAGKPEDCVGDENWAPMELVDVRDKASKKITHQLYVWPWGSAALFPDGSKKEIGRAIQHGFEMDDDDLELRKNLAAAYAAHPLSETIDFQLDSAPRKREPLAIDAIMKALKKAIGKSKERYRLVLSKTDQAAIREALANNPEETPHSDLEELGLPSFKVLRRWVGIDPPTELETLVRGKPAWKWIKECDEDALDALAKLDVAEMIWQSVLDNENEYAFFGLHSLKWEKGEKHATAHAHRTIRYFGALLDRAGVAEAFAERAEKHLKKEPESWLAAVAVFGLAASKKPFPKRFWKLALDADFLGNGLNIEDAMRDVIALIPEKDREAFVDQYAETAGTSSSEEFKKGRRIEVPMLLHRWWFADLVPTDSTAKALAADMEHWDNDPKPVDEALAIIQKLGPICAPHLKKALKKTKSRHKKVIEKALALVSG